MEREEFKEIRSLIHLIANHLTLGFSDRHCILMGLKKEALKRMLAFAIEVVFFLLNKKTRFFINQ